MNHAEGHLVLRTDATLDKGIGHIMRCLALAQEWRNRGGRVTFISQCESEALRKRLIDQDFGFIPMDNIHPDPLDLAACLGILSKMDQGKMAKLVVTLDGYHFDSRYQRSLNEKGHLLLIIDDIGHFGRYYGQLLLNQNIHARKIAYRCSHETEMLIGSSYVLLRNEFQSWKHWMRQHPKKGRRLLVTMGGSDSKNATRKVVEGLQKIAHKDWHVKIVMGPTNPHRAEIEGMIKKAHSHFELIASVEDMPSLLAWGDVAISGGGSTCYEMAFMGLPNLIMVLADNQDPVAGALDKSGCAVSLGFYEALTPEQIGSEVLRILNDREIRLSMSEAGRLLIDGNGVQRVCDAIYNKLHEV